MKFLKNIAMAALISTALAGSAMAAPYGGIDAKDDLATVAQKVGVAGLKKGAGKFDLKKELLEGLADLQEAIDSFDSSKPAAKFLIGLHQSLSSFLSAQKLPDVLDALTKQSSFDIQGATGTSTIDEFKEIFDTQVVSKLVPHLPLKESKFLTDLKAKADLLSDMTFQQVIDDPKGATNPDGSPKKVLADKEYSVAEVIDQFDDGDTSYDHDDWAANLISGQTGETLESILEERGFVDPAQAAKFHQHMKKVKDSVKPSKHHEVGFGVLQGIHGKKHLVGDLDVSTADHTQIVAALEGTRQQALDAAKAQGVLEGQAVLTEDHKTAFSLYNLILDNKDVLSVDDTSSYKAIYDDILASISKADKFEKEVLRLQAQLAVAQSGGANPTGARSRSGSLPGRPAPTTGGPKGQQQQGSGNQGVPDLGDVLGGGAAQGGGTGGKRSTAPLQQRQQLGHGGSNPFASSPSQPSGLRSGKGVAKTISRQDLEQLADAEGISAEEYADNHGLTIQG